VSWKSNDEKNRTNKRAHGLSFETARFVFDGPLAVSNPDPRPDGDRWRTVGLVGAVLLFVSHTWPEGDPAGGEEVGRIISAGKATAHERRAYEEGFF
jgi:hypothetical protein